MKPSFLLAAVTFVPSVAAHTIFVQLAAGGKTYNVQYAIRDPSYEGVSLSIENKVPHGCSSLRINTNDCSPRQTSRPTILPATDHRIQHSLQPKSSM